jgi:tetratricopeptide (TPR) repeat protein
VGRERELEELRRYLHLAIEGKGTTVFVSGEAGCGKTRLVAEFLDLVNKENVSILAGWCLSNAAQPYFPFVEAFESYLSTVESGHAQQQELKGWLTGHGQAEGREIAPQVWKDQTFAAITKELLYMSTNKPIILFIDDVHWADSASLALLHYIARAITSERLLVIATFRSEEIAKLEGHPHPLAETLRLMAREELFTEIKLQNLNTVNVGRIAENMLGGSLDSEFVERLSEESQGNPLFVVEALRTMYGQGSLVQEHGQWRLTDESIGIPAKVKDVIMRRLDALKPNQRRILDAASVIGEKFDPKLVADVFSEDSVDVLEALNAVAQSTLLVFCEGNQYRFKHAKIQEMLYNEIPPLLKTEYHSRIAASLEANSQNVEPFPFSDVTYHYAQAGNKEKSVKYALAAAKDELARWSNSQAIKHFLYVLGNMPEGHVEQKRTALEGLGDAYVASCMYGEAIKTFDKLAESETGALRLHAIRKAMDAAYDQGDKPDLLLTYARKAEEVDVEDRLEMARIIDNRAKAWAWSGRGDVKMDLADYDAALKVFEEENSLVDVAEALCRSGTVSTFFKDLREKGLGQLLRSLAIFRELGDVRKEAETTMWLAQGFQAGGLTAEAIREYSSVLVTGRKLGIFDCMAQACWHLSNISSHSGKPEEALSITLKELELCNKTDSSYRQGAACAQLAYLYSLSGNLQKADKYFNRINKLLPIEFLSNEVWGFCSTLGVYYFSKGWLDKSDQAFKKAAEFYKKVNLGSEIWFRENYAWVLEKRGCVDEAKVQQSIAQKLREHLLEMGKAQFGHTNLQLSILVPRHVQVGEEFMMRLDLVNVAKNPGALVKFEGLVPSDSKVTSMPSFCKKHNSSIQINKKKIGPFQVETTKLKVVFGRDGVYKLEPCVFYVNDLGESKKTKAEPITITAQLSSSEDKLEGFAEPLQGKFEFKSEAAEKTFNFLINAFVEDYIHRRLPQEKSGWRTLMQVMKGGHLSKHSLYGQSGKGGEVTSELEHLGLIETRLFYGERGRGGHIHKVRICYEKEIVKRQIDQKVIRKN